VRFDRRGGEAEVVVVFRNFLVDSGVMDGERDERNFRPHGVVRGEETPVDVIEGGGGNLVVVNGDELDADVVQREFGVAVVGEDDADGQEAVLDVGQTEKGTVFGIVARLGGDGDLFFRMGVEGGVLIGGIWGWGLPGFVGGNAGDCEEAGCSYY